MAEDRKTGWLDCGTSGGGRVWIAVCGYIIELADEDAAELGTKLLRLSGATVTLPAHCPAENIMMIETRP